VGAERIALSLALALATGCAATHPQTSFRTEVDFAALRADMRVPAALRGRHPLPPVAVLVNVVNPPVGAAPAGTTPTASRDEEAITFAPNVVGEEFVRLLEATGVFEAVVPVGERRGELYRAEDAACRRGASYLFEVTIDEPVLRRTGISVVWPMILWATAGAPSMWCNNHDYEFSADVRIRLHCLASGEVIDEKPLAKAFAAEELNFHERTSGTWRYFKVYLVPSPFMEVDGDKVARFLATSALRKPLAQFLEQFAEVHAGARTLCFSAATEPDGLAASAEQRGPVVKVTYPPVDAGAPPLDMVSPVVRLAAAIDGGRTEVREVRVDGRRVFPARTEPGKIGYWHIDVEDRSALDLERGWVIEAVDALGRTTVCRVRGRALDEPKPRESPAEERRDR
jgi:hypothetical protein